MAYTLPLAYCPSLVLLVMVALAAAPVVPFVYPNVRLPSLDINVLEMSVDGHPSTEARSIALSLDDTVGVAPSPEPFALRSRSLTRLLSHGGQPAQSRSVVASSMSGDDSSIAMPQQTSRAGHVDIIFFRSDTGNILEPSNLESVRDLEESLRTSAAYASRCQKASENPVTSNGCLLPDSAINFLFPSLHDGVLMTDGKGPLRAREDTIKALLLSGQEGYFDRFAQADDPKSVLLTARYFLGAPLAGYASPSDREAEQEEIFTAIADHLLDVSRESMQRPDSIRMLFFGSGAMITREIFAELALSIPFAGAAVGFVLLYLCIMTQSAWLAGCACLQIVLTFPITYWLFIEVMGYEQVGIMNLLSLWAITGIGCDDVFVITAFYDQALASSKQQRRRPEGADPLAPLSPLDTSVPVGCGPACAASCAGCTGSCCARRLCCCCGDFDGDDPSAALQRAIAQGHARHSALATAVAEGSGAMLVTSATTAASFYANAISRISAVRSFGLWTGTLVVANYVLVLTLFVAALSAYDSNMRFCFTRWRRRCGISDAWLHQAWALCCCCMPCSCCRHSGEAQAAVRGADGLVAVENSTLSRLKQPAPFGEVEVYRTGRRQRSKTGRWAQASALDATQVRVGVAGGDADKSPALPSRALRVEAARVSPGVTPAAASRRVAGGGGSPDSNSDDSTASTGHLEMPVLRGGDSRNSKAEVAEEWESRQAVAEWGSQRGSSRRLARGFGRAYGATGTEKAALNTKGTSGGDEDDLAALSSGLDAGWHSPALAQFGWCVHWCRWPLVAAFVALLATTAVFASELRPAQEPPLLLVQESNLETVRVLLNDYLLDCAACLLSDDSASPQGGVWEVPAESTGGDDAECSVFGCHAANPNIDAGGGQVFTPTPSPSTVATATSTPSASASALPTPSASPSTSPSAPPSRQPSTTAPPSPSAAVFYPPGAIAAAPRPVALSASSIRNDWYPPADPGSGVADYELQSRAADDFTAAALVSAAGQPLTAVSLAQAKSWARINTQPTPYPALTHTLALDGSLPGGRFQFRVAARGVGGLGPFSPASADLTMPGSIGPPGVSGSPTPSSAPGGSSNVVPSASPTASTTPGATPTASSSASTTPTRTATPTPSTSGTPSTSPGSSPTPSITPTGTPTASSSVLASQSATPTASATASATPSNTATPTATGSASPSASPSVLNCATGYFGSACEAFCGGTAAGPALPPDPVARGVCSGVGTCNITSRECDCQAGFGGIACAFECPPCGPGSQCARASRGPDGQPSPPSCQCLAGQVPVLVRDPATGTIDPSAPYGPFNLVCAPKREAGPLPAARAGRSAPAVPGGVRRLAGAAALDAAQWCPAARPHSGPAGQDSVACSGPGRGRCVAELDAGAALLTLECECFSGFRGEACEQNCPTAALSDDSECSGNGECNTTAVPASGDLPVIGAVNATCLCSGLYSGEACDVKGVDPFPKRAGSYARVNLILGVLGTRPNPDYDPSTASSGLNLGAPGTAELSLIADSDRPTSAVFDPAFDLSDPAAQTYMVELCEWMNSQPSLVLPKDPLDCWMRRFREYIRSGSSPAGVTWPVSNATTFSSLLLDWSQRGNARHNLGYDATTHRFVWARMLVRSTIDWQGSGYEIATRGYPQWAAVTDHIKATAPASLGSHPVQAADAWLRAFVEVEFVSGTAFAIGLSVGFSCLATLLFVQSVLLSLLTAVAVGAVLLSLLAFVVVSGGSLGVIEAIAVVCLVGLSIDAALHFAHGYMHAPKWLTEAAEPAERRALASVRGLGLPAWAESMASLGPRGVRASFASQKMTGAIVSSAVTTAGASAFLLFTRVEILRSFGLILVVCIGTGLVVTLLFLNASLAACGPTTTCWRLCRCCHCGEGCCCDDDGDDDGR